MSENEHFSTEGSDNKDILGPYNHTRIQLIAYPVSLKTVNTAFYL